MFERLRQHDPNAIKKIVPIDGDCLSDKLGIDETNRKLLTENVTIIFHFAATLKLEAKLKDAIEMNTVGTVKMLELAKEIKHLKVFVHLSTAFCSADLPEFKEDVYRTSDDPKNIIQVSKWIKDEALEIATPAIIRPHPNTYTYTKRLAETIVADEYPTLPVVIARPSIVTPAGIEPLPGWVDSLNGPMGILVGAAKGVIRSMHVKGNSRAQVVPVDVAINALIIIAWKMGTAKTRPAKIPVYNMTNDGVLSLTWEEVLRIGREIVYEYPFEGQIWYPDGDMRSSKLVHKAHCIFFHWIPAYLIDFLMIIFRQKRFMVRLMGRIDDGLQLLQFFTTRDWFFESTNFVSLNSELTPIEKKLYPMDFNAMPIREYLTVCMLGARQYLMKEDLKTLPRCRRVQSFLYLLDRAFAISFYLDDLLKARQQLKRAECESDLNTDEEGSLKRKRKQKQYSSSDENDDNGVTIKNRLSTQIPSPPPPTSNQGNTSTDLEKHVTILETQDNSTHFTQALENVAKKLAKICQRLDAIEENQRKILEKVGNECSEPVQEVQNLPEGLIPCSSLDEIKRLENWLKEAVHEATLVWISYL
ncbi:hypothetical protein FQA39_LY08670 [Lamprigera yunnana]|nr:hypothetical protein FQA39_LY08670 [Lamprigera yunnana]